ncbi:RDD family protein [Marinactinospora thermotolerans]|uniref:Uncharacterized membrane protein YckC, RDD family n=1 Tax=Marinactinospora thermotolerans DSM 45154 TaxID=1122192 RepID=A0A1T4N9Z3_9ACTN|nr:RDD family protein [Marinactinospora thermotolerans]SJZ75883.1 Uncharacterized membrane protein YckC, RDD family [Marinactinospora thermotolerans DSM 45154]
MSVGSSFAVPPRPPSRSSTAVVGRRLAQAVLDVFLSSVLPVLVLSLYLAVPRTSPPGGTGSSVLPALLVLALGCLAHAWYWVIRPHGVGRGQTTGMRLLGIRPVSADGGPVSAARLTVRWLLLPVDLLVVGLVVMLLSPRHQRLGDLLAGTFVVRD